MGRPNYLGPFCYGDPQMQKEYLQDIFHSMYDPMLLGNNVNPRGYYSFSSRFSRTCSELVITLAMVYNWKENLFSLLETIGDFNPTIPAF